MHSLKQSVDLGFWLIQYENTPTLQYFYFYGNVGVGLDVLRLVIRCISSSTRDMEGAARFRKPLTEDEERLLVESTIPKNTRNSTKWSVKLFEDWQRSREDITPRNFVSSSIVLDMSKIHDLSTPLHCMNAETLNLWLCRFVEEVCKGKGERYPPRTLYVIVCGLKRYI